MASARIAAFLGAGALALGACAPTIVNLSPVEDAQLRFLVVGYLDNYADQLAVGFERAPDQTDHTVRLLRGQSQDIEVRLQSGVEYRVLGSCDNECADVDLAIYDSRGRLLDSDLLLDDYPVLNLRADTTNLYRIRVTMASCRIAPCYAAVRIYQAPQRQRGDLQVAEASASPSASHIPERRG